MCHSRAGGPLGCYGSFSAMQAADLPESPLAAAAALPCGRSCWLPGWCTRVLRQVWQAKECASTLARYCGCQLVCICRSLIAAFRCAGVISFSKPFLASLKVVSPAKGPLEQARLVPAIRTSDAAAIIGLNMTPIKEGEIVQLLSVWWHPRITAVARADHRGAATEADAPFSSANEASPSAVGR
jgi:hypothetical protein